MSRGDCINCGEGEAESYDLRVRSASHCDVPLCSTCRATIERELDNGE